MVPCQIEFKRAITKKSINNNAINRRVFSHWTCYRSDVTVLARHPRPRVETDDQGPVTGIIISLLAE